MEYNSVLSKYTISLDNFQHIKICTRNKPDATLYNYVWRQKICYKIKVMGYLLSHPITFILFFFLPVFPLPELSLPLLTFKKFLYLREQNTCKSFYLMERDTCAIVVGLFLPCYMSRPRPKAAAHRTGSFETLSRLR